MFVNRISELQPELGNRRISYALCARSGFTPQLWQMAHERRDILLFDLEAILASDVSTGASLS